MIIMVMVAVIRHLSKHVQDDNDNTNRFPSHPSVSPVTFVYFSSLFSLFGPFYDHTEDCFVLFSPNLLDIS